jgi:MFS transporter, OFA family, oxalate/formate antiporter
MIQNKPRDGEGDRPEQKPPAGGVKSPVFGRLPFFYGWIILFIGTLGVLMSIPGQTVGISVFTDFLIEALELKRSYLSMAYLIGTISSALMLSSAGRAYDRFGARSTGVAVALFLGLTLLYLSMSDRIAFGLTELFLPAGRQTAAHTEGTPVFPLTVSFIVISIGFFLIRFFGQGTLTLVSRNMIMKWFERRRGMANAVLGVSMSFGFSMAPRGLDGLIGSFGWRSTWRLLALVLFGFTVLAVIFYRDSPRDLGLKPDGGGGGRKKPAHPDTFAARNFRLAEARKTYAFWLLTLSLLFSALLITAFTFHVVSIFETGGLGRDRAVAVFFPMAISAVIVQFGGSWISDYIRLKWIVSLNILGTALVCAGIWFLGEGIPAGTAGPAGPAGSTAQEAAKLVPVLLLILGAGITQGTMGITGSISWPRYFGLAHLGEVSGYAMAWTVAGSAVGPYVFSLSLDFFGSYGPAAAVFFFLTLTLFFTSFWIRRPQ